VKHLVSGEMQVTLLRDSKSRFGFAVGVEAAGVVITKIAPSDALPLAGMFDERDRVSVGDVVLSVGATPLVNERGLPISGIDLESVRSLIKDTQGDSITLTVQRPLAAPSTQLSKPAAAAGPAAAGPAATARDVDNDETVVLIRDAQGLFGLNVDQDDRGIFVKQVCQLHAMCTQPRTQHALCTHGTCMASPPGHTSILLSPPHHARSSRRGRPWATVDLGCSSAPTGG